MRTDRAPFLAYLFLYENESVDRLMSNGKRKLQSRAGSTFRTVISMTSFSLISSNLKYLTKRTSEAIMSTSVASHLHLLRIRV